jgi:hypothetical protein
MTYASAEARQSLLEAVAAAGDRLGAALALLGTAYDQLDERTADRLEEELFRPVQTAYGRIQRVHGDFAGRHGLAPHTFAAGSGGLPSEGVKALLQRALAEVDGADHELGELQDTMLPVEVGDPELRAGLAEVRTLLDHERARGRELLRTFGR